MQTEEGTRNCALSAFWLQTVHWGASRVCLRASGGCPAPQCISDREKLLIRPPLVIRLAWPGLRMCIFIPICIYSWVYLFPSLLWQADFWCWAWLWVTHWNSIFPKHTFHLIYFPISVKNNNIIYVLFKLRVTCILTECEAKWLVKLGCRHLHVSLRAGIKETTVVRMEKKR